MKLLGIIIFALTLSGCATSDVFYSEKQAPWKDIIPEQNDSLLYSLYMIGDAGDDTTLSKPILNQLENDLKLKNSKESGIIFLGDNIYPNGLHKKGNKMRSQDELRINVQLDILKNYSGDIFFIPGNHDWNRWEEKGLKYIKRQEKYIQNYLDRGNTFRPSHGCPGPDLVKLAPGLVLIIIDTEWWLHKFEKSAGEKDGCDVSTTDELIARFSELLKKNRDKNVIVAGHHPLYSNGEHGGNFKPKDHLFPLTKLNEKAYIPLPVIGSIYPFYRKFLGHRQDIPHPVYRDMKAKLVKEMNEYENVIYVAGHEHNLQYAKKNRIHHIISGSGSKITLIKHNKNIDFGASINGYSKISYYENGAVWLEFITENENSNESKVIYRKLLFRRSVTKGIEPKNVIKKSYVGLYKTVVPDSNFSASKFKRVFLGNLNRDLWTTPVKVPYLDIHFEKGGLTPIKKGGGRQTLSLRMRGGDGKQYSLRSVKKNSVFLTEKELRGTIVQDALYDGMAGSHPYASVVVPELSIVSGVYYSKQKLVFVPKDTILGDYLPEFGGILCLLEERPNKDMTGHANFGNSTKVMSYFKAVENMHENHNHVLDESYILNARLFDMVIGDWDRHNDQWRWARFKENNKVIYRPIPRDRDQVFFEFDGIVMKIANRKWLVRRLQPLSNDIRDIAGFNFNGQYFDREFLTESTKSDWIEHAKILQGKLTDQVIEEAIKGFPKESYDVNGEKIIEKLKSRRDKLPDFAERYYNVLAKTVSVVGTLENDYFEILRLENGAVEVNVYPRKKGKKKKNERFYHRVFQKNETDEIRLYGLDGNDEYQLKGKVNESILVRIISGFKSDRVEDKSRVKGLRKMTKVYDTKGFNEIRKAKETKLKTFKETMAYSYNSKDFKYNNLLPLIAIGLNPDDGVLIGPGFKYTAHGFKKSPYKYYHKLLTSYSFESKATRLIYEYDYIDLFGKLDFGGKLSIISPFVFQFYGIGNENQGPGSEDDDLFNLRMYDYKFSPNLKLTSKDRANNLIIGLSFQHINFDPPESIVPIKPKDLEKQDIIGTSLQYKFINQDNKLNPYRGIQFLVEGNVSKSVVKENIELLQLKSELSMYFPLTFIRKQTTFGVRSGVSVNFGDYLFYQSNFLSGIDNFRGITRNRFSGRIINYNNFELRVSLIKVPNYIVPLDFGLLAHYDAAKTWENNITSKLWHKSYGAGVYMKILDYFMLVGTYSISENNRILTVGTKFLF